MSISKTAYEQILREYDAKQLAAKKNWRLKLEKIESEIPELAELNSHIASLSIKLSISRINNQPDNGYKEELETLKKEKEFLLFRAGYSAADLLPQYECALCHDTGFIDGKPCSCLQQRITDSLYDQSNIKEILKKENFSTYTFNYYSPEPLGPSGDSALSIAKNAVNRCCDFIKNFKNSTDNLFITGETGVGKTFLTNCIAKELLDQGVFVLYLSAVKFFKIMAGAAFSYSSDDTSDYMASQLLTCDLLIIDDLGTEMVNSLVRTSLFNCVNERILRGKHTIISTNFSLEQLRDNYSERIFSRIMKNYILINLKGKDIRILKKLEG